MGSTTYVQRYDGDKIEITSPRLHKIRCCDCGLVHLFKFRMQGSTITFRMYRDDRATAQSRRHRKKQYKGILNG